jgi:CPA1 family monovalent cation:H+ antiporter
VSNAHLFVVLLASVVVLGILSEGTRLPGAVVLVVGAAALGLTPFAPELHLDPDVVLLVFLPPILFPAAAEFAREDVRTSIRAITMLAFGLALLTLVTVAVAAHFLLDLPWAAAFVLGAILAPTDPVSATALLRSTGAPDQIATILEGESLVNDAVGLTAFRIAVASVGGTFSLAPAIGEFALVATGGVLIGIAAALLVVALLRRLENLELESAITVLSAYGSYLLAEEVGVSGILAVVAMGFVVGRRLTEVTSPETRLGAGSFWGLVRYLSESMLFVLVGLVFAEALRTTDPNLLTVAGHAFALAAVALATRLAWMFTVPGLIGRFQSRGPEPLVAPSEMLVLSLGGMRGAVSVAVALAIPLQVAGAPFPSREAAVLAVLGAVVILLILPTLLLPSVVCRGGLRRPEEAEERDRRTRLQLAEAAVARAEQLRDEGKVSDELFERASEVYEARTAVLQDETSTSPLHDAEGLDYKELLEELRDAERAALQELEASGEVHGGVARAIERDLDRASH